MILFGAFFALLTTSSRGFELHRHITTYPRRGPLMPLTTAKTGPAHQEVRARGNYCLPLSREGTLVVSVFYIHPVATTAVQPFKTEPLILFSHHTLIYRRLYSICPPQRPFITLKWKALAQEKDPIHALAERKIESSASRERISRMGYTDIAIRQHIRVADVHRVTWRLSGDDTRVLGCCEQTLLAAHFWSTLLPKM